MAGFEDLSFWCSSGVDLPEFTSLLVWLPGIQWFCLFVKFLFIYFFRERCIQCSKSANIRLGYIYTKVSDLPRNYTTEVATLLGY